MLFARPGGFDNQAKHICKLASSARAQIAPRWRVLPRIGQSPKPAKRANTVWSNAQFFTSASDQAAQFAARIESSDKSFSPQPPRASKLAFALHDQILPESAYPSFLLSPRSRILYRLSVKNQYSPLYHDNSRYFLIFVYIYKKKTPFCICRTASFLWFSQNMKSALKNGF